jgi:hypothetical protein
MSSGNVVELTGVPVLADAQRLPADSAKRTVTLFGVIAGVGVVLSVIAALADPQRFAFSYLTGFAFTATIAAVALFFVILQYLTKAGWSVAARRQMEWIASSIPVLVILFIPVVIFAPKAYAAWWAGGEALHNELLVKKAWWLNGTAFVIRGFVYLIIFSVLGWFFSKKSFEQDTTGDPAITLFLQKLSAPTMLIFALTISFAGFDWLMSLQPLWYSTIFGVYTFAAGFYGVLGVLALMTIRLQTTGLYKRVSTVEHRHDIGKLMFAFTVFWAYIAFSQFMLIFYANLPEETIFFRNRWFNSWSSVSVLLILGHFAFPFLFLLSRHVKRNAMGFTIGGIVLVVMHYVDMYWLVMPILDVDGPHVSWIDLAGLLAPAGVLATAVALRAQKTYLYPIKDPRLAETLHVENF